MEERRDQLRRFEVLLLNQMQVEEFEKQFRMRMFDVAEPLFHSWLSLKFGSVQNRRDDVCINCWGNVCADVCNLIDE